MKIWQPDLHAAITELQIWRSFLILRYISFLYRRTLSEKLVVFIGKTYTTIYDRDQTGFAGKCCKIEWQNCPPSNERRHFFLMLIVLGNHSLFFSLSLFSISPMHFSFWQTAGSKSMGESQKDIGYRGSDGGIQYSETSLCDHLS